MPKIQLSNTFHGNNILFTHLHEGDHASTTSCKLVFNITQLPERVAVFVQQSEQVSFSMAIKKVELMHECDHKILALEQQEWHKTQRRKEVSRQKWTGKGVSRKEVNKCQRPIYSSGLPSTEVANSGSRGLVTWPYTCNPSTAPLGLFPSYKLSFIAIILISTLKYNLPTTRKETNTSRVGHTCHISLDTGSLCMHYTSPLVPRSQHNIHSTESC